MTCRAVPFTLMTLQSSGLAAASFIGNATSRSHFLLCLPPVRYIFQSMGGILPVSWDTISWVMAAPQRSIPTLQRSCRLRGQLLSGNGIGDDAAAALSSHHTALSSLQGLHLHGNGIGANDAAALGPLLSSLQSLSLNINRIGASGPALGPPPHGASVAAKAVSEPQWHQC